MAKDEFKVYIDEKIESRKLELINNQNLGLRAKQEFIHLFEYSQSVSTMRGSHFILLDYQKQVKVLEAQKKGNEYHAKLLNKENDELRKKIQDLEES